MDSPSPPPPPDPVATAAAQGTANLEAARATTALNRPNQVTPYGSLNWQNNGNDQWTSTVNLDPRVQKVVDAQLATSQGMTGSIDNALGRVNQTMAQPLDMSPAAMAAGRDKASDAVYQSYTRNLDPQFARGEEAMKSDLMNRGFMEGTQGYQDAAAAFGRQKNDAYQTANTAAQQAGAGEQERMISDQLRSRNQIINELASLRSGAQVQAPQFSSGMSGANVNAAPVAQSAYQSYQGQLNNYNADTAGSNALMGGLFSLGGSALGGPMGGMAGSAIGKLFT